MKKLYISLNHSVYVGFTVLDLSKLITYKFHYEHAVRMYGPCVLQCMTDTDSLLYDIHTDEVYKDMAKSVELFDRSEHPKKTRAIPQLINRNLVLLRMKQKSSHRIRICCLREILFTCYVK